MDSTIAKVKSDRAYFDNLGNVYAPDASVNIFNEQIGGVSCFWFTPKQVVGNSIIIYLHGGSFALGSLQSHRAMVSHISGTLKCQILFVEYARSPEKPFPHGVNDVVNVYKKIIKRNPHASIIFIGDSAGGGLAVSAVFCLKAGNLKLPDRVVLISPWINLRCNTVSFEKRKTADPILTKSLLQEYAAYYAPGNIDEADPSQLQFESFPPAFLLVGSNEVLFDDTKNFYDTIKSIQPTVKMKEYQGQNHVWLLTDIHL